MSAGGGFLDLRATCHEIDRGSWLRVFLRMKLRGRAAIVDPCHLPGEPAEIGRGLGRDNSVTFSRCRVSAT